MLAFLGPDLRAVRAGPVQGPGLGEPREHPGQGDGRACAGARVGSPAPTWGRTSDFVAGRVLSVATGPGGPDARGAHDVTRQDSGEVRRSGSERGRLPLITRFRRR